MSHKHTKKDKKHHHHNNNVAPSCIMAEKKGGKKKGKSNDKRHKKKTDSLRRAKSGTRLHDFFSKTNILLTRKEDEMAPSKMPSDAAVNVNAEQSSAPTKHQKSLESPAHTPITAVSPQPQSAPEMSAPPKWKAEDVALKYIEKLDAAMARLEFVDVCGSTQV
uniref:Uncharacterized protein n=1 Tax=Caenorhabditis japonica TaxID=281687 RepID=A0A8R1EGB6_CAEJA